MTHGAAATCTLLPWDTEFFGFRIARLDDRRVTPGRARDALTWCEREQVACLYFLADSADAVTTRTAREFGFDLVDIRVTLERPAPLADVPPPSAVRALRDDDVASLAAIAKAAHSDSRFYFDGRFPPERCDQLYAAWIERACRQRPEGVLVATAGDRPAGYVTCSVAGGVGAIGLLGVAADARGRGLGQALVAGALDWFEGHGACCATVVTQGRNIPAQALYQRHGFRTSRVELWYHRWFQEHRGE